MQMQSIRVTKPGMHLMVLLAVALALVACGAAEDREAATNEDAASDSVDDTAASVDDAGDADEGEDLDADESTELLPVTFAVPGTSVGFVYAHLAVHLGYFEEEGLDVSVDILSPPAVPPALAQGDIEATGMIGSVTRAANAGQPLTNVLMTSARPTHALVVTERIRSLEDLVGEAIVTAPLSSTPGVLASGLVDDAGLTGEIEVLSVAEEAARATVFTSGQSEAFFGSIDSVIRILESVEGAHVLVTPEELPSFAVNGVGVSQEFLSSEPEAVDGIVRASLRAGQFVLDNPDESIDFLADHYELSHESAVLLYDLYTGTLDLGIPSQEQFQVEAEQNNAAEEGGEGDWTAEAVRETWNVSVAPPLMEELGIDSATD